MSETYDDSYSKFSIYAQYSIPALALLACVGGILMKLPGACLTAIGITAALICFCFDPFRLLERFVAPQTKAVITFCTVIDTLAGYAYYYAGFDIPPEVGIFLAAGTVLLLGITLALNRKLVDIHYYLDCSEVSSALVGDPRYKYQVYWERRGRRMCRSLLDMHMMLQTPDDQMENVYRHVFILGLAAGDDYSSELLGKLRKKEEVIENQQKRYDRLNDRVDQEVDRRIGRFKRIAGEEKEANQIEVEELKESLKEKERQIYQLAKRAELAEGNAGRLQASLEEAEKRVSSFDRVDLEKRYQEAVAGRNSAERDLMRARKLIAGLRQENELLRSANEDLQPEDAKAGRPRAMSEDMMRKAEKMRGSGASYGEISKELGVSKSTIIRELKKGA